MLKVLACALFIAKLQGFLDALNEPDWSSEVVDLAAQLVLRHLLAAQLLIPHSCFLWNIIGWCCCGDVLCRLRRTSDPSAVC
jgi:hypothetical protein